MLEDKQLKTEIVSQYLLGGGLEPHFRVLFSAMFQGVSLGNFHQGSNLWKGVETKL